MKRICASALFLCLTAHAFAVRAQPPAAREEAAARFDRALRLVDNGDLSGGLAEFQRAYALVPSAIVAYNTGLVFVALHRPVEAVRALAQALQSPSGLTPEKLARGESTLREQQDLVGQVAVSVNAQQGVVEVDNVVVAQLPLSHPLEVATGAHVISVVSPGFAPSRREVLIAGKHVTALQVELIAIETQLAQIAITCRVPAVDVFVDKERVGKTPLEATVSVVPGEHQIELRRDGYAAISRSISLHPGSQATLALSPVVDANALVSTRSTLSVRASESQAVLHVDGSEIGLVGAPLALPNGPHRIRLERGGFLPAERDVELPLGATLEVAVVFEPTPETRAQFVAAAEQRRAWSIATLGAGALLAGGGVALAVLEQRRLPPARSQLSAAQADASAGSKGPCDTSTQNLSSEEEATCATRLQQGASKVNDATTWRNVGWITAGVGGAVAVTGFVLLLTGDSPHRYDPASTPASLLATLRVLPAWGPRFAGISASASF